MIEIIRAKTAEHLNEIRRLFREYEAYLGVDLCFQNFEKELKNLPGKYAPPTGALLVAMDDENTVGCVAVRELKDGICEMKRLFVRPQFRRRGIGRMLANAIIENAKKLGYSRMRLDTLSTLKEAMTLYVSLGFQTIEPYYHNPLPDVVYWELELEHDIIAKG